MDIWKKYSLDKNEFLICKELPKKANHFLYYLEKNDFNELYINENSKLKLIVTKPSYIVPVILFLKKYRAYPELLPKNLKHEYPFDDISSEYIYKAMQLMLKPMNSFEEFKERLLLATEELMPLRKRSDIRKRLGEKIVFVNKKEELGSAINIYGEKIKYSIRRGWYKSWWIDSFFGRDIPFEEYGYTPNLYKKNIKHLILEEIIIPNPYKEEI